MYHTKGWCGVTDQELNLFWRQLIHNRVKEAVLSIVYCLCRVTDEATKHWPFFKFNIDPDSFYVVHFVDEPVNGLLQAGQAYMLALITHFHIRLKHKSHGRPGIGRAFIFS